MVGGGGEEEDDDRNTYVESNSDGRSRTTSDGAGVDGVDGRDNDSGVPKRCIGRRRDDNDDRSTVLRG